MPDDQDEAEYGERWLPPELRSSYETAGEGYKPPLMARLRWWLRDNISRRELEL